MLVCRMCTMWDGRIHWSWCHSMQLPFQDIFMSLLGISVEAATLMDTTKTNLLSMECHECDRQTAQQTRLIASITICVQFSNKKNGNSECQQLIMLHNSIRSDEPNSKWDELLRRQHISIGLQKRRADGWGSNVLKAFNHCTYLINWWSLVIRFFGKASRRAPPKREQKILNKRDFQLRSIHWTSANQTDMVK